MENEIIKTEEKVYAKELDRIYTKSNDIYTEAKKERDRIIEAMYFELDRQHIELNGDEVFIDIIPLENKFKNIATLDIVREYLEQVALTDWFEYYNKTPKEYVVMLCINSMYGGCYLYDSTVTIDDIIKKTPLILLD